MLRELRQFLQKYKQFVTQQGILFQFVEDHFDELIDVDKYRTNSFGSPTGAIALLNEGLGDLERTIKEIAAIPNYLEKERAVDNFWQNVQPIYAPRVQNICTFCMALQHALKSDLAPGNETLINFRRHLQTLQSLSDIDMEGPSFEGTPL